MARVGDNVKEINKTEDKIREPGMFHVIFLNDNYTPMDFVVEVLMKIFGKSENDAITVMMKIHEHGESIVGTYIEDVALTKSEYTRKVAKDNGFPLKTKIQPA